MELALAEADKALAANPNLAIAHRARAAVLVNSGKHAEGIAAAQTALRLEPRGPSIAATMNWITGSQAPSITPATTPAASKRLGK